MLFSHTVYHMGTTAIGLTLESAPGEIHTAFQKGVNDGFALLEVGLKDHKNNEVAKYLAQGSMTPSFGYTLFY